MNRRPKLIAENKGRISVDRFLNTIRESLENKNEKKLLSANVRLKRNKVGL